MVLDDFAHFSNALLDDTFGPGEFEEESWRFFPHPIRVPYSVDDTHLYVVKDFDTIYWNALSDNGDRSLGCRSHGLERNHGNCRCLWCWSQFEGDFGNDTERAFRADKESIEIVTSGRLPDQVTQCYFLKQIEVFMYLPGATASLHNAAIG